MKLGEAQSFKHADALIREGTQQQFQRVSSERLSERWRTRKLHGGTGS